MLTAIVILDGVGYEVPAVVADRMTEFHDGAIANLAAYNRLHEAVTDFADREHKANEEPLKSNRLDAHYAKKHLYRMVGRQLYKRIPLKPARKNDSSATGNARSRQR